MPSDLIRWVETSLPKGACDNNKERAMTDVRVRTATLSDIAAITRIYADAVRNGTATFEIEPPAEAEIGRRVHALQANNYPYLVAERTGIIAGYAYAGPYHLRPAYRWTVEDSIYLDPQFQRQGIGRLLMRKLLAEVEGRGFRQMIALVGDSTNTASIALHEAAGFQRTGTLRSVGFKHGRWLDVVMMQRSLGSADASPP
jgi:L-amino acid N-acyltransferase YncA